MTCSDSEDEYLGFVFLKDIKETSEENRENFIVFIMDTFYIKKKESSSYSRFLNYYSYDYLIFDFNVKPFYSTPWNEYFVYSYLTQKEVSFKNNFFIKILCEYAPVTVTTENYICKMNPDFNGDEEKYDDIDLTFSEDPILSAILLL